ncbi:hypothetical protein [Nocardioides sp. L-11A]|uniref:hypothetical protein n=1 Tax=Nocardioides sp. L-11A TaxID=3043848 RepID=UPI00249AD0C0
MLVDPPPRDSVLRPPWARSVTFAVFTPLFALMALPVARGPFSLSTLAALVLVPRLVGGMVFGALGDRYGATWALRHCLGFGAGTSATTALLAVLPGSLASSVAVHGALLSGAAVAAGGAWPLSAVLCAGGAEPNRRGRAGLAPQLGVLAAVVAGAGIAVGSRHAGALLGVDAWIAGSHAVVAVGLLRLCRVLRAPMRAPRPSSAAISLRSWRRILLAAAALSTTFAVFTMATAPVATMGAESAGPPLPVGAAGMVVVLGTLAGAGSLAAVVSDAYSRQHIVLAGTTAATGVALTAVLLEPGPILLTSLLAVPAALPFGCGAALLPALFPADHRTICVAMSSALGAVGGAATYAWAIVDADPAVAPAPAAPAVLAAVGCLSALCIRAVIRDTRRD